MRVVIFDVDGVLVQSMERHYESYARAFSEIGVRIERHEVFANEGRGSRDVIRVLAEARRLGLDAKALDALNQRKKETFASFGPMPLYPGAREAIEELHARGLQLAAVTGTARQNVERHLGEMLARFDAVVTADDVERTKPDPEPYLKALAKLGVRPDEAVVVENAPLGIRAGKRAGLRVVAIASTLPRDDLAEADVVVPDIRAAMREVERLP